MSMQYTVCINDYYILTINIKRSQCHWGLLHCQNSWVISDRVKYKLINSITTNLYYYDLNKSGINYGFY